MPPNLNGLTEIYNKTRPQIKSGTNIPNQEYIKIGIQHNIEDSVNLYKSIVGVNTNER